MLPLLHFTQGGVLELTGSEAAVNWANGCHLSGSSSGVLASNCDFDLNGTRLDEKLTVLNATFSEKVKSNFFSPEPAPHEATAFDMGGGTASERDAADVRGVLPTGWQRHPASQYSYTGSILELTETKNALEAGARFGFGFRDYYGKLGGAGHWGISKTFVLGNGGGRLNAVGTAMPSSPTHSCSVPTAANFSNFEEQTWMCEDEAFLWFEFFSADGTELSTPLNVSYSTSMSHQAAGAWTLKNGNEYAPEHPGIDLRLKFSPISHTAKVPEEAVSVRVTLYASDGTHHVTTLGYKAANAAIVFGRLDVGYDRGIEVAPAPLVTQVAALVAQNAELVATTKALNKSLVAVSSALDRSVQEASAGVFKITGWRSITNRT